MFLVICEPRPDKVSLDPNIKMAMNVVVGFRSNNKATGLVATDDNRTYKLDNRTALFLGSYDKYMKTPFINDDIIYKYIGDKIEKNHKYIKITPENKEEKCLSPTSDNSADKVIDIPNKKDRKRRSFKI